MPHRDTQRHNRDRLEYYYRAVNAIILSRQNPCTGLIPASVAVTTHGDYRDAWVRDNVYSIMAVWGLALAYRRIDDFDGRVYELEHSVIKLMRGLLFAMMRQAHKVEEFKKAPGVGSALHAKYNTATGDTVVGDWEWGHLQIDATSIFLLALAEMSAAGLYIVFTQDEADFVQNLVFYIERAYSTPDYGIWERGNKINHGEPELNSSSIGMATAALQAINGVNLFGSRGGHSTVVHVLPDELTRNLTTLQSALPRESNSKEIDAALLSVISFPAFAVRDPEIVAKTKKEIITKLGGKYGMKRFLRDGHQTVLEDTSRLHYDPAELKKFEAIESEWPLFFTYMILDGLFTGDHEQVEEYRRLLEPLVIDSATRVEFGLFSEYSAKEERDFERRASDPSAGYSTPGTPGSSHQKDHILLIPELYYVPKELVSAEKANPHSQVRIANDNVPLVWANSLFFLGQLIYENLLSPAEMDPLGQRFNVVKKDYHDTVVQITLLAEDSRLQSTLSMYGLETQTLDQVSPVNVLPSEALVEVYANLGANSKLGLSGRPKRPIGSLGTCRLYKAQGQLYFFTPHFMDSEEFYLTSDNDYLISMFESELQAVRKNWNFPGRPTMVIMLTHAMLGGLSSPSVKRPYANSISVPSWRRTSQSNSKKNLLNFFMDLRTGMCNGVRVRLGRLTEQVNTSNLESLDFLTNRPGTDWVSILASTRRRGKQTRKLGLNERQTNASAVGHTRDPSRSSNNTRRALSRRSSTTNFASLKSPIGTQFTDFPTDSYFNNNASAQQDKKFKLRDHDTAIDIPSLPGSRKSLQTLLEDAISTEDTSGVNSPARTATPPTELDSSPPLNLTWGDSAFVPQAIEALSVSVNLYDQIDLLEYLHSCHGADYYISELDATVRFLLDEVYVKSLQLKLWSIVRQVAGLLSRKVNSLSVNITDLVIRQKQVSLGSGKNESFIDLPVPSKALGKLIDDHCHEDDVREDPLVQELIIYLGGFIRTTPELFDGILRLRTHFIIIALREEISRMHDCDEDSAIEQLMHLSPFELQSLLRIVMSGPALSIDSDISATNSAIPARHNVYNPIPITGKKDKLVVSVQSGGFLSGNFARIEVNGNSVAPSGRGLNVVVIDPVQVTIVEAISFDSHISEAESDDVIKLIEWLDDLMIVVICVKDDAVEHLTAGAKNALESLGSASIQNLKYRDSWCMIGVKGAPKGSIKEAYKISTDGPTDILRQEIDLTTYKKLRPAPSPAPLDIAAFVPNSPGRWLRRRKNDGALNRMPPNFYSRVWRVLERSADIKIYEHLLPRKPTVYEKTPEEFSFALLVENFLGYIMDPAERQIGVETLMAISKISSRYPDVDVTLREPIDITVIMRAAMEAFWKHWVTENKHLWEKELTITDEDLTFEKNVILARRLFCDLPQDGRDGTYAYLSRSALKLLPFDFDLNADSCHTQ